MSADRERTAVASRRRLTVKTVASQADDRGSTPRGGTRTIPEWWEFPSLSLLDLGIVDDSALLACNDLCIFAEQRLTLIDDLRPTPPRP